MYLKRTFRHSGKYTADEITIDDVISSLLAQKALIEAGTVFLAEIDPDFKLDRINIRVDSIQAGSLSWDILVDIYGQYQTQIEKAYIGSLEGIFDTDIPEELEGLVTLSTLAILYWIAKNVQERVAKKKGESKQSVHINKSNDIVINKIVNNYKIEKLVVENALKKSMPPFQQKRLVDKVADFLRPAKRDPKSMIEIENGPNITAETIKEFPNDIELKELEDNKVINVEAARIDIRAVDRDKKKTGWSAVITNDNRFEKRLPMDLYPTVNQEELAKHQFVVADLAIECEEKSGGGIKPKKIHLLSFNPADD